MAKPTKAKKKREGGRTAEGSMVQAERFFAVYVTLGPSRTVEKLRAVAARYGLPAVADVTLRRYSAKYQWVERAHRLDEEAARSLQNERVRQVQDMNQEHAVIGSMGVRLAARGLDRLLRLMDLTERCDKCGTEPITLDAHEIAKLMDSFAKWQRMGLGEATDRREIAITVWNIIIHEWVQLFLGINIIAEPEERKSQMLLGVDEIVNQHLAALTEGAA